MNKGLEAVKKLYEEREYTYAESVNHKSSKWANDIEHYDNIGSCLLTIEKELKDKDELAQALSIATCENGELLKYKKALEIIKEKGIILQFIKETYTVEQYNAGVFGTLVKPLTQEEYDLLKEVLL